MSRIPDGIRNLVKARAKHRCERCQAPAPRGDLHHRRGRSVVDEHTHCPCNLVVLCRTCHTWAHAHPEQAMGAGWIVGRWVDEPETVPIPGRRVRWRLDCHGTYALSRN